MFGELEDYIGYEPSLPGLNASIWIDTTCETKYPKLEKESEIDVAVVGGGLAGLLTAFLLKEEGRKVAVLESHRICEDVTGHTTAKITSAHGISYKNLIRNFGLEKAKYYARSNQLGIKLISTIVKEKAIECDFRPNSHFIFSESIYDRTKYKEEADAVHKVGLPGYYTEEVPLPDSFETKCAIRFIDQAQFHPRKFLLTLAEAINGDGSNIYEDSKIIQIEDGDPCLVRTKDSLLRARKVIVATNYPIYDKGSFYTKLYPRRSYALGLKIKGQVPEELFYLTGQNDNYFSIRNQPTKDGLLLILGGIQHKAGQGGNIIKCYKELEKYAKSHFQIDEIKYHWSTQDNFTSDNVPYIGLSPKSKNVYLATGFGGWGMTNSAVTSMLISDLVLNKKNPWSSLYDPNRVKPIASAGTFFKQNVNVAREYTKKGKRATLHFLTDVKSGKGEIIEYGGKKVAVSNDDKVTYVVSPFCTHKGCQVNWNNAEKTWDCPCHGSRYKPNGEVIHSPATQNLEDLSNETGQNNSGKKGNSKENDKKRFFEDR